MQNNIQGGNDCWMSGSRFPLFVYADAFLRLKEKQSCSVETVKTGDRFRSILCCSGPEDIDEQGRGLAIEMCKERFKWMMSPSIDPNEYDLSRVIWDCIDDMGNGWRDAFKSRMSIPFVPVPPWKLDGWVKSLCPKAFMAVFGWRDGVIVMHFGDTIPPSDSPNELSAPGFIYTSSKRVFRYNILRDIPPEAMLLFTDRGIDREMLRHIEETYYQMQRLAPGMGNADRKALLNELLKELDRRGQYAQGGTQIPAQGGAQRGTQIPVQGNAKAHAAVEAFVTSPNDIIDADEAEKIIREVISGRPVDKKITDNNPMWGNAAGGVGTEPNIGGGTFFRGFTIPPTGGTDDDPWKNFSGGSPFDPSQKF